MDNAQRFLSAYVSIEKSLRQIVGTTRYSKFYLLLQEAAKKNKFAQKYEIELQEYADLRNAIVHQRDGMGKIIAQPTDDAVEDIEKIRDLLSENPSVSKYFLKHVSVCHLDDDILDIEKRMREHNISKIPVYSEQGIVGLLTLDVIAKWACAELITPSQRKQVRDIYEEINDNDKVYFLSKNANVYEVVQIYNNSMRKGKSVLAIIITEDGIKSQKPIGIITVSDLPYILEYF
ncbi:CBS domain-containing protein [Anaerorhabdus sp.]|jgi:predicted transcriptional regulator|uniref:CBS domain-containing protein n=1 Tax=Anaerorhabdus sp. TaxID=1872524 RepID=UPI002FCC4584